MIDSRELILELSAEILSVETGYVGNSDVLRTFHLTGPSVGARAETKFVHLGNHSFRTARTLNFTLRQKCEGTYTS